MEKLNTFRHITSFIKAQCIDPNSNQEFTVNSGLKKWASCIKKHANHCDTCKEQGPAIGYCRDCKGFIDESCYHYHQIINTWLNHDIVRFGNTFRISDFMPRFACKGHTRLAESYCVNCKYIVCPKYIKRHQKKNHCLNSLKYLCLVIEAFHCSKSIAKELIKQIPKNTATESLKTYLCTIIRLVDVTLGIIPESSSIAELTKVHRIIERNTGSSNRFYAECKDVLGKLLELNEDLLKNSQYSLSPETVNERQEIFDKIKGDENHGEACAGPTYKVTFLEAENIEDDWNSFSITDSSITLEQNPIVFGSLQHVQSTEFGPYMMDHTSLSSGDLFPSQIQEPDEETAEKQLEGDITVLQTATQSVYFQDLHPV